MVQIIGYNADLLEIFSSRFRATAVICGVEVSHTLSPIIKPHRPIDVGRSQDSDLVWVTEVDADISVFTQKQYDPPIIPIDTQKSAPVFEESFTKKVFSELLKRKKVMLFSVGVFVLCALAIFVFPLFGSRNEVPQAGSEIIPTVTTDLPEQAAIDFVRSGQIKGFSLLEEDPTAELSAHVVSQSGEIVLVEISAEKDSGEITFATLLLQRIESEWRIRQVLDVVN